MDRRLQEQSCSHGVSAVLYTVYLRPTHTVALQGMYSSRTAPPRTANSPSFLEIYFLDLLRASKERLCGDIDTVIY